jgi:hypothetical protein
MSKREEFQARMEEALALWSARFDALKKSAGKEAKAEITEQLERWHAAKEIAAAKLAELKAAAGETWDVVRLELEGAWRAVESVLDDGQPRARLITREEIEAMTPEQRDAILEAMVVAIVVDGRVEKDEIARFNSEVDKVPWAQSKEEVVKKAQAAQARVAALANDDERQALLKNIAARLPPGPIAEKTLGMMALVMTAGTTVNAVVKDNLAAFAQAFGITTGRLAVITASIREHS